ncbi:unnamed protein product, partial [Mesorhabditis belari]|uniref:Pleiotropic regulator 1 n=1 Tax=Mesorhabditis belari TaxID=2138241 RepID=A0AAF3FG39_9BILA
MLALCAHTRAPSTVVLHKRRKKKPLIMSTEVISEIPDPQAQSQEDANKEQQADPAQKQLLNYVFRSMKRTYDLFATDYTKYPDVDDSDNTMMKQFKKQGEYKGVLRHVEEEKRKKEEEIMQLPTSTKISGTVMKSGTDTLAITAGDGGAQGAKKTGQGQLLSVLPVGSQSRAEDNTTKALLPSKAPMMIKPKWHAPWKLYRVISGHTGWVRAVDVEPGNEWFATGGADRIIKIWDLASGRLRLSLTGHISSVRAVKVSHRNPFLFSGGEDKQVKCWDLEYNKVVRHYHGHLSAVQAIAVHPTLDILVTTARDATARVWDIRTKAQIHCLSGHTNTVADVVCQSTDPQVITASHDSTVRLWDLAAGKTMCTLTHHKVRVFLTSDLLEPSNEPMRSCSHLLECDA